MRFAPLLLFATLLFASLPAQAGDECTSAARCFTLTTNDANAANGAVPKSTYYLYGAAALCQPPASGQCAGRPTATYVGLLYEETNGLPGLQRWATQDAPPDTLRAY